MVPRAIAAVSLLLLLSSCKFMTEPAAPVVSRPSSPVIESLKDSGLPCFKCHAYEQYALNKRGAFSHDKHVGFDIHCNHCHIIKAHKESTINRDVCNNCHQLSDLTYDASGMKVIYSHQSHSEKFNCSECHPQAFNMKKGTTHITMDDMYKGKTCGKCHNGTIAFKSTACTKCHEMKGFEKVLSYRSGGIDPARFSHKTHTAMFECNNCHAIIFKYQKDGSGMKMDDIYTGKYCGSCHNDQVAFGPMACNKCHKKN